MRFAIDVPNFGDFADPRLVADLARRAEQAGWDALFVWDHVTHRKALHRTPIADEFGSFGEPTDPRELAARLDEGLTALNLAWSGEPVTFRGQHVVIEDVVFRPTPGQRPRIPIWVGGEWPAKPPMRRAARWDGAMPIFLDAQSRRPRQPDLATVREVHAFLNNERARLGRDGEPFDLVISGTSRVGATDLAGLLAEAGATWWAECIWDDLERAEPMLRRADQGPPQLT